MGDFRNEFSWSKSRDTLFRECPRAYYYNHYGAWGGWRDDAPDDVRELYVMKNLCSRPAWRGIVVHDVAERALSAIARGRTWPLDEALGETEARMREEVRASADGRCRAGLWLDWGGRRIKANGLMEHYYNLPLGDSEWQEDLEVVLGCVRNLYRSATFKRLQERGSEAILSVEELQSFEVEGVKVWVKLDACVRGHGGKFVIIDWKTGTSHRKEDIALQIGIYGLFGSRTWEVGVEKIVGYDVNLRMADSRVHQIDSDTLNDVSAYIVDSAARMRALLEDEKSNVAAVEKFPMTSRAWLCKSCRFRRACSVESE